MGAGRPVDGEGFPIGPWTPELLATAISQIDGNISTIDLRTVQLWFQENEKGISSENIRWLARIFGCDDPEATGEWQAVLSGGQTRLSAKRRRKRKGSEDDPSEAPDMARPATPNLPTGSASEKSLERAASKKRTGSSLARRSEALFSRGSPLDLPASVFAGAVALGFLSYLTGVHNVAYTRADGLIKQVGFLWAPNWTLLFMVFMPLAFAFMVDLVVFWKNDGRPKLLLAGDRIKSDDDWAHNVEASSYTYWAVLLICLLFAGLFQWIGVRLIPLMRGGDDYATDWGSMALVRPEIISVPEAVAFTGLAYLYMCLCFYLFFAGLILLYSLVHDFWKVGGLSALSSNADFQSDIQEVGLRVMSGIFRCTVLGLFIAICMKIQSFYLTSNGENILAWLAGDISSVFHAADAGSGGNDFRMPTQYSSLLVAFATCVVFFYGSIRIDFGSRFNVRSKKMTAVVALLVAGYLSIGAFSGFSILLSIGMLLAMYGLFDPGYGAGYVSNPRKNPSVS